MFNTVHLTPRIEDCILCGNTTIVYTIIADSIICKECLIEELEQFEDDKTDNGEIE